MYYVYILQCQDGTLYTGFTTDPKRREEEHRTGRGGHYTSSRKGEKLLYVEQCVDRSVALKREAQLKGWRREKKLALISQSRA